MSTRSRIGIINQDGSVDSVWQHWDGYPEHTGAHLLADHNSEEKARALVAQGDRCTIERPYGPEDYETPEDYEAGRHPRHDANEDEFWSRYGEDGEEYAYLWKPGRGWMVTGAGMTAKLDQVEDATDGCREILAKREKDTQ